MNFPAQYNPPKHYKGDTLVAFNLVFTYPETGDPVDFTGATAFMQLRDLDGALTWEFNSEDTGENISLLTFTDPGVLRVDEILTWNIEPGVYKYDLQVSFPNGDVFTYLRGNWTIKQDISWKTS